MIAKSDRLNEHVRRATQLDDGEIAALADPTARRALFQEITSQTTGARPASARQPARRRTQLAAAAAGVVVAASAVLVSTGVLGPGSQRPPVASVPTPAGEETRSPERHGDPFGTGASNSCVHPDFLGAPTFAFDGTVASIGTQPPADPVTGPAIHVPVTFTVTRWFRGGNGDRVTVAMPPASPSTMVENAPSYTVGSRLLVSGTDRSDDPRSKVAWTCGFTLWYNRADAQAWERAGGYAPSTATPAASSKPS